MNIYWCYEKHDYYGLFVIAETAGKAKVIFARETDEEYIDIRCQIIRRGVNEGKGVIDPDDTKTLEKYNLFYTEEEW